MRRLPSSVVNLIQKAYGCTSQMRNFSGMSSLDKDELKKFIKLADQWWDVSGPHRGLHEMNPVRVSFLKSEICRHFQMDPSGSEPLRGLKVIDVGCGGGLLCEPLARLGATVTGLDAARENIQVALMHAARDPQCQAIQYLCSTAEDLVQEGRKYDAVISLEVIEHVVHPEHFVRTLGSLCRDGGLVAMSTLNRTLVSYLLAIQVAENLLRWLEPGTHQWSRFVTPSELAWMMRQAELKLSSMAGLSFDPLSRKWGMSEDLSVNYICVAQKSTSASPSHP